MPACRMVLVFCFLVVTTSAANLSQAQSLQIETVGLSVAKPDPNSKFGGTYALGMQSGVKISLMVNSKNRRIVNIAFDKQSPLKISAGGSVLNEEESDSWQLLSPNISKDGLRATLSLSTKQLPPAGSQQFEVEGQLLVSTGQQTAEAKVQAKLAKGTKFDLVGIPVEITEAGKPSWGDEPLAVTLQTSAAGGFDKIQKIEFLDAQGNPIKSESGGRMTMDFGGSSSVANEYRLAKKIDAATIKVIHYQDLKTEPLPLKMNVGIGL